MTAASGQVHEPETPERCNQGVRWKIVLPRAFWTAVHKGEGMQRQVQRGCLRTQLWTQRPSLNNSPSNSKKHIPSEKLLVPQLIKILASFTNQFQYRIDKSRYMNAVHTIPSYSFKIHFRIILQSTPMPSKCYLSPSFPHQSLYKFLLSHTRATCPSHLISLDLITLNSTNLEGPRHPASLLIHLLSCDQALSSAP